MVWLVLVYAAVVMRVTGLVTVDRITQPGRTAVLRRVDEDRPMGLLVGYLLTCQWCASIWVAAVVVPVAWMWGANPWVLGPALVLAASQVTGMTSQLGRS